MNSKPGLGWGWGGGAEQVSRRKKAGVHQQNEENGRKNEHRFQSHLAQKPGQNFGYVLLAPQTSNLATFPRHAFN